MRLAAAALAAALSLSFIPALPAAAQGSIEIEGPAVQGGLVRGRAPSGTVALRIGAEPVSLAPDGRFLIGFDRDQPATALLTARLTDGRTVEQAIAVAPRRWPIERIDVARRPSGVPDEAYRRRREAELARIRAARARRTGAAGWQQSLVWPARGRISGLFGAQRIYRGVPAAYHGGVDVAAGAGAPVVAPADGVVVLAGPPAFSLEGNLVIVDHGMGLNSAFLHLATVEVSIGQPVRRGQRIGTVGATGRATGPHLHWSLTWSGARLDPQLAAGPMGAPRR
ncbi:MAG TPA: M23 family metallopeptidase [Allosphingosinicella sp.]|nr:M23 family metallopeptidase [Allosphingosinicella sp.]